MKTTASALLTMLAIVSCSGAIGSVSKSPSQVTAQGCPSGSSPSTTKPPTLPEKSHVVVAIGYGEVVGDDFVVEPYQQELSVLVSWETGADLIVSLVAPSGRIYNRNTTDPWARAAAQSLGEKLSIDEPESGDWAFQLFESKGASTLARLEITQVPIAGAGGTAAITESTDRGVVPLEVRFSAALLSTGAESISTYEWDFGDCSPLDSAPSPSHVFVKPGRYTIGLRATDATGQSSIGAQHVLVTATDQPPTAMFIVGIPDLGDRSPLTVSLDASSSFDIDGQLTAVAWEFGDSSTGTGNPVTHKYAKGGAYPVTLKVTDNGGLSASTCRMINAGQGPWLLLAPCS